MTFCFALSVAHAQVANDNLENRHVLRVEEVATSTTVGCTVQRSCVDERLTGKCIEYHNDQWFEFTPTQAGTYYVNIGGQKCRDVRGVQLVVLTGTPCQTATYHILSCTSFGTQDDLFVVLPNLQAGQPYLLDVDGYLKDYCSFTLQVSGQARGLPVVLPAPNPPATLPSPSRIVQLSWQVPDSLARATTCRVLRRELHAFRSREIWRGPIERDTYGHLQAAYTFTDTLAAPGQYLYQVVAEADDPTAPPPALLKQQWVSFSELQQVGKAPYMVSAAAFLVLPVERYPPGATLQIVIRDPASGRLLRKMPFGPGQPGRRRVYAQDWVKGGVQQVNVDITYYPPNGPATTDHLVLPLGQ
ncbi:MAG: hypothetical protein ACRYFX_27810 [Janthinobacterium lividum]